jgi:hypothetical protein
VREVTTDDWIRAILSNGAVGALVGALALWRLNETLATKARRADYLREQIKNLYGPVTFLLEAGERSFDTHNKVAAGYEEYFRTRYAHERYSEEMGQVLATQNHYGGLAVQTNREAAQVLKEHWGWLDAEDTTEVSTFLTYVERQRVERDDGMTLPVAFYTELKKSLPAPVVFNAEWPARFRKKLKAKQEELLRPSKSRKKL